MSSLLVDLMGKKPKKPESSGSMAPPASRDSSPDLESPEDPEEMADDASSLAFDAFADAAGISEENRGAAKAALRQYIDACMSKE